MPRNYVRKPGTRQYKNYQQTTLERVLQEIRAEKISVRAAASKYGIHRNTLSNKLKIKHNKKSGGQTVFTEDEESSFVSHIVVLSSYGFPVNVLELRLIVKSYLDKQGRKVKQFGNANLPGREWAKSFLKRHEREISNRVSRNITHGRASISEEVVNEFFNHLEKEIEGVPACNIWNFDETCLVDDPGSSKVLVRRGCKYPENIKNSSKSNTSIMMCGSAGGEITPVYVVYKAERMWESWMENGPEKCRYNRTKSGWFDYQCFEDWFKNLMLPILKKQVGKKIIIGDNLSSHINMEVIHLCQENNIAFIALPPNATHLLQPLDVAYFRPMKIAWRKVLNTWKEKVRNSRCTSVPKEEFPSLLKELIENLKEKSADNIKAGFRKCGIYPLNRQEVLNRLPMEVVESLPAIRELVGETFIQNLNLKRQEITSTRINKKRKKVNVPAGKSITIDDINPQNDSSLQPSTSTGIVQQCQELPPPANLVRKLYEDSTDSDEESVGHVSYAESDQSPYSPDHELNVSPHEIPDLTDTFDLNLDKNQINVGNYVLVNYENQLYPGEVKVVESDTALISAMVKCGAYWKWPTKSDSIWYFFKDIKKVINKPIQISRRNIFKVPEMYN